MRSAGNEASSRRGDESLELADAVMRRGPERYDLAREAFRRAYPNAPEQMISAAVFHVYVDGIAAARDWLADAERFLREPAHRLCHGASSHLLYHLYNWHQLEALIPHGRSGMLELLRDISSSAEEGDLDAIKQSAAELKELLESTEWPPQLGD